MDAEETFESFVDETEDKANAVLHDAMHLRLELDDRLSAIMRELNSAEDDAWVRKVKWLVFKMWDTVSSIEANTAKMDDINSRLIRKCRENFAVFG